MLLASSMTCQLVTMYPSEVMTKPDPEAAFWTVWPKMLVVVISVVMPTVEPT